MAKLLSYHKYLYYRLVWHSIYLCDDVYPTTTNLHFCDFISALIINISWWYYYYFYYIIVMNPMIGIDQMILLPSTRPPSLLSSFIQPQNITGHNVKTPIIGYWWPINSNLHIRAQPLVNHITGHIHKFLTGTAEFNKSGLLMIFTAKVWAFLRG